MNAFQAICGALDSTYDALEAKPKPERAEGDVWVDSQEKCWFRHDGVSWLVGRGHLPPDVRRAFLQAAIDKERHEPYAMPGNDTCPRCGGTGRV